MAATMTNPKTLAHGRSRVSKNIENFYLIQHGGMLAIDNCLWDHVAGHVPGDEFSGQA